MLRPPRFGPLSGEGRSTSCGRGDHLAIVSTHYRLLRANGEVPNDDAGGHPPRVRPELMARRPLVVWSWDLTTLKGPRRGEFYYLYVVLVIFSRTRGWCAAPSESGELTTEVIADAVAHHQVPPGPLTVHAEAAPR